MLKREQLKRLNKENIAWKRAGQHRLHRERMKRLNKENIVGNSPRQEQKVNILLA
jgi:hypothetical protein